MKNIHKVLVGLIILALNSCQSDVKTTMTTDNALGSPASEKKEVMAALNFLNQAMLDRSEEGLNSICSEQLSYGHSNGNIQTKDAFMDEVLNGAYDYTSILTPELTIEISRETAIARFVFDIKGIKNEEPQAVKLGCVQAYQKKGDHWKLLMRQAYKL
ncbi:MAG: nuclear transport factor 2 family protein [Reichenbachiella sp.]